MNNQECISTIMSTYRVKFSSTAKVSRLFLVKSRREDEFNLLDKKIKEMSTNLNQDLNVRYNRILRQGNRYSTLIIRCFDNNNIKGFKLQLAFYNEERVFKVKIWAQTDKSFIETRSSLNEYILTLLDTIYNELTYLTLKNKIEDSDVNNLIMAIKVFCEGTQGIPEYMSKLEYFKQLPEMEKADRLQRICNRLEIENIENL